MNDQETACWHKELDRALDNMPSAFDRLQETHFHLHSMENHYHSADHFRWSLGGFLKCLNEVPKIAEMELQNKSGFKSWFKEHKEALNADGLSRTLTQKRNDIVHKGMLIPSSKCTVGATELRGIKLGMGFQIDPREDSDTAMSRYLHFLVKEDSEDSDFLGVLVDDEDCIPCVHREWKIEGYDEDLIELCAKAWLRLGVTFKSIVEWLGANPPPLQLDCLKSDQQVQFKLYDREKLKQDLVRMKAEFR